MIHQEVVETARTLIGDRVFEQARSRGDRMTIAEAIVFANELSLDVTATVPPVVSSSKELSILTTREREVVRLVIEGCTDREIAHTLSISTGTASRHVANILHKLDVPTRSAAAAWAIRNGLK